MAVPLLDRKFLVQEFLEKTVKVLFDILSSLSTCTFNLKLFDRTDYVPQSTNIFLQNINLWVSGTKKCQTLTISHKILP